MKVLKRGETISFRPYIKTAERLDYAKELGLEQSDLINDVLEKHLRDHIAKVAESRTKKMREMLAVPVP